MQMQYVGTRAAVEAVLEWGFRRAFEDATAVPLQPPGAFLEGQAAVLLDIPESDLPRVERFSIPAGIADRYPVVAYRGVEARAVRPATRNAVRRRGGATIAAAAVLLGAVASAAALPIGRSERRKPLRATPPKAEEPSPAPARRRHRRAGTVRRLQRALGLHADGRFGPRTQRKLERWQRSHGLHATGVAGAKTQKRLGLRASAALKRETTGSSVVRRVIAAADRIATAPYRYGGGHGSFGDSAYDCSGSVSYALQGGGLLSAPLDSSGFMGYGQPGPGAHISIYANPGHVYMTVDGRRFDTSARARTGSRWGAGAGSPAAFVVRHPPGL
jgi:putative peptidoglycan binding protein